MPPKECRTMEIDEDRLLTFIETMNFEQDPEMEALEERALAGQIPIIRRDTQCLLRFLLSLQQPQRILEIGTAIGFSALFMARVCGRKTKILTIEQDEKRCEAARENFARMDGAGQILLKEGDARNILPQCRREGQKFDLIFMDAAKGQYPIFLREAGMLLSEGGVLVTDNVLQNGTVLESRYAVERRDRTIHARMRAYLRELLLDRTLITTVLSVGDGMALSYKKRMQ